MYQKSLPVFYFNGYYVIKGPLDGSDNLPCLAIRHWGVINYGLPRYLILIIEQTKRILCEE